MLPTIRALYKSQRDAMLAALKREMQGLDVQWNTPDGGMFLWARLPQGMSAVELLPRAVEKNVAFVPGAPFYAQDPDLRTLRLSFVTATTEQIDNRHRSAGTGDPRGPLVLKIWGRISSINVRKVVLTAQWLGIPFERVDAGHEFGIVKTPAYRDMNPNALVPTVEDGDFRLWESNVIVRYLSAKHSMGALYPAALEQRFDAERWMDWQQDDAEPRGVEMRLWHLLRTAPEKRQPQLIEDSIALTEPLLRMLDAHLAAQPFMTGDAFTMADIPIACEIHRWRGTPVPQVELPHVDAWYAGICGNPASRGVLDLSLS